MKAAVNYLSLIVLLFFIKSNNFCYGSINFILYDNDTAQLECPFEADGKPVTKWSMATERIKCNHPDFICDKKTLQIKKLEYETEYTCEFCDDDGDCDYQNFLFLHYQTNFKSQLKVVAAHDNVFLECGIFSKQFNGAYTSGTLWYKHKKRDISQDQSERIIQKIEKDRDLWDHKYDALEMRKLFKIHNVQLLKMQEYVGSALTLFDVKSTDEGWYTCVNHFEAAVSPTTMVKSVYLKVVQGRNSKQITPLESVTAVAAGSQALTLQFRNFFILACPLNVGPCKSYAWYHNNTRINCNDGQRILCTQNLILIDNITSLDIGSYKCSQGKQYSKEMFVNYYSTATKNAPFSVKSLTMINQIAKSKENFVIQFDIPYHFGLATIGWLKHSDMKSTIDLLTKIDIIQIINKRTKIYNYLKKHNIEFVPNPKYVLELPEVGRNDEGFYTCLTYDYNTKTYELHNANLSVIE